MRGLRGGVAHGHHVHVCTRRFTYIEGEVEFKVLIKRAVIRNTYSMSLTSTRVALMLNTELYQQTHVTEKPYW